VKRLTDGVDVNGIYFSLARTSDHELATLPTISSSTLQLTQHRSANNLNMIYYVLLYMISLTPTVQAYYISTPVPEVAVKHCGSTPTEAKQLGCQFDLYSFAWYQPECYNGALHDRFLRAHQPEVQWQYGNETFLPTREVLTGMHSHLTTTTGLFHDLHCTYEWLRLLLALAEKRPLDVKLAKTGHGHHCSMNLLAKGKNYSAGPSSAHMLYGHCGLTAELMHEWG
jgi:hypothetical protein